MVQFVNSALEEVGKQIKEHAIKVGEDLGNLGTTAGIFCDKYSNSLRECNCTLLVNKNDEIVYEENLQCTAAVLRDNKSKPISTNMLVLNVEDKGSTVVVRTNNRLVSEAYDISSIEWHRKYISKEPSRVIGANEERYILSADDIGAILIVKVNSKTDTLHGEIGPFDIDVVTRKQIENYLISGMAVFDLELYNKIDNERVIDSNHLSKISSTLKSNKITKVTLKVTPENLVIENHNTKDLITKRYESTYPLLTLDVHSPNFELCLDKDRKLYFRTLTKYDRDVIVLTIRAFHGKKLINNSFNLSSTEELTSQVTFSKLNTDLCNAINACEQIKSDLERVKKEKNELEREMAETITSFREMQMTERWNSGRSIYNNDKNDDVNIETKLANALAENNRLDKLTQSQRADLEKAIEEIGILQTKIAKLASL